MPKESNFEKHPAQKSENLEIKTKEELEEAKKEAGVTTHEEVLERYKKQGETFRKLTETITATDKETNKEIEINLETERQRWQEFYENHNFEDKVDIPEIYLTDEQIREVKTLIEQGFVDSCAIIPDHLTYQELGPEMTKGYDEYERPIQQLCGFEEKRDFNELDKLESTKKPQYRIIFYKKVRNVADDKRLETTKEKSPDRMEQYLKQTNKQLNTQLTGISLKDYLIIQREFAETTNTNDAMYDDSRRMDQIRSSSCLKSRFKSLVIFVSGGCASHNQLLVGALPSTGATSGSRLSRSFEIKNS